MSKDGIFDAREINIREKVGRLLGIRDMNGLFVGRLNRAVSGFDAEDLSVGLADIVNHGDLQHDFTGNVGRHVIFHRPKHRVEDIVIERPRECNRQLAALDTVRTEFSAIRSGNHPVCKGISNSLGKTKAV